MNHYEFPVIEHIDIVRQAIEDRDEFVIAEREYYDVVNYLVNMPDSFPNLEDAPNLETELLWRVRRECRGIVFDKEGKPLARRFHKFFNINERPETQAHTIDISKPHHVLLKEDGSMITPFMLPTDNLFWHRYRGTVRQKRTTWGTKMGTTEVSDKMIRRFISRSNYSYEALAMECILNDITPIFEWCSTIQQIVLDYPSDKLVLTAARHLYTGQYLAYDELCALAEPYNVPVVEVYDPVTDLESFIEKTRNETDHLEGYVIRFEDGHMLKQKTDWYCLVHGAVDTIQREKNVLQICISDEYDDFCANCTRTSRERLDRYRDDLYKEIHVTAMRIKSVYDSLVKRLPSADKSDESQVRAQRAAFAKMVNTEIDDKRIIGMLFTMHNKQVTATSEVIRFITENMKVGPAIDENRDMINGLDWLEY